MALDGEAIYDYFFLVPASLEFPVLGPGLLPASKLRDCCGSFVLKALANRDGDEYKNDRAGFLFGFNEIVSMAEMVLKRYSHTTGQYETVANLDDDTFGTFYELGFHTVGSDNYIGYQLKWLNVFNTIGTGTYKVVCTATISIGGTVTVESMRYCLEEYTAARADVTVRVEYRLNKSIGDSSNDFSVRDFGLLNWYNAYRLPGYFGFPASTYETEYIQYQNGQRLWVKDGQEPEYTLKLKPIPGVLHEILRTDVMQADEILITDYNSKNPNSFVKKGVYKNSAYAPDWKPLQSKLAPVEIKFRQTYNNLRKRKC